MLLKVHTFFYLTFYTAFAYGLILSLPETIVPGHQVSVQWSDPGAAFFEVDIVNPITFVQNVATSLKSSGSFTWTPPDLAPGSYQLQAKQTVPPFAALGSTNFIVGGDQQPIAPSTPSPSPAPQAASTAAQAQSESATPSNVNLQAQSGSAPASSQPSSGIASTAPSPSTPSKSTQKSNSPSQGSSKAIPTPDDTLSSTNAAGLALQTANSLTGYPSDVTAAPLSDPSLPSLPSSPVATASKHSSTLIGAAVGGALGGIALIIGLLVFFCTRRPRIQRMSFHRDLMVREVSHHFNTDPFASLSNQGWAARSRDTGNESRSEYDGDTSSPHTGDLYSENGVETDNPMRV